MASFEHKYFAFTGQFAMGAGNQKGTLVNADGEAQDYSGFSGFLEGKLPEYKSSLIGRFDRMVFETDDGDVAKTRMIVGYAYHFLHHSYAMLDFDRVTTEGVDDADWEAKVTMQVYFP